MILLPISAATAEPSRQWSAWSQSVAQYGFPDTDDPLLTVECDPRRGLSLGGGLATGTPIGGRVVLTLSGEGFSHRIDVKAKECGDVCFSTPIKPGDPALKALVAGRPLTLSQGRVRWTISGVGADRFLNPLIAACAARKDR